MINRGGLFPQTLQNVYIITHERELPEVKNKKEEKGLCPWFLLLLSQVRFIVRSRARANTVMATHYGQQAIPGGSFYRAL